MNDLEIMAKLEELYYELCGIETKAENFVDYVGECVTEVDKILTELKKRELGMADEEA
jgi:hypothetical protein